MKKVRKTMVVLFVFLGVICTITGCGKPELSEKEIIENLPENVKTIVASYDDIEETQILNVDKCEISKRKINETDDTVYCTIYKSNDYYECLEEWMLYYEYYDKGGWVLETTQLIDAKVTPKGIPQNIAENEMEKYFFDTYEFVKQEIQTDEDGTTVNCIFDVSYSRTYCSYDGEVALSYYYFSEDGIYGEWASDLKYGDEFEWDVIGSWNMCQDTLLGEEELQLEIEAFDGSELTYYAVDIEREMMFGKMETKEAVGNGTIYVDYNGRIYMPDDDEQKYKDLFQLKFCIDAGWERDVRFEPDSAKVDGRIVSGELHKQ